MPAATVDVDLWTPVIGLEVHAQMKTRTKLFCGCPTSFGAPPNTHVCPVCLGLPGSLPVLNGKAFEFALKTGLALDCEIAGFTKQDRKNYYYPDLPKNYQISQYDLPFATNGHLDIELDGGETKRIGVTRVHLEEDAGKLVHDDLGGGSGVDLNRAGTPLIEIVSEPDLRSPAEARVYMEVLAKVLEYLEVCDCNMQEGSLRCDANVSIRPPDQKTFNTRREIKNMNSFRFVEAAIAKEIAEQREIYATGGTVQQSTRLFNGQTGEIRTMRTKEDAQDYRYFPEPDLPPITVSDEFIARVRESIGESPEARLERYQKDHQLNAKDAAVLVDHKALGDYFESLLAEGLSAKAASTWVLNDSQKPLKDAKLTLEHCGLSVQQMGALLKQIEEGVINRSTAKDVVFPEMLASKKDAQTIVKEKGLAQVSDTSEIEAVVDGVISSETKLVADYVGGKDVVINALFGRCMKALKGKGNPKVIRPLLEKKLKLLREGA